MTYLKRNINLLLLIVTVVLVGYSLSLTAYYQTSYNDVTGEYYERVQEYDALITDLEEREQKLEDASTEITRKTQDKEKLNELYDDLAGSHEQTKSTLAVTEAELADTKSDLFDAEEDLDRVTSQLSTLVEDIEDVHSDIASEVDIIKDALKDDHGLAPVEIEELFDELDDEVDDLDGLS